MSNKKKVVDHLGQEYKSISDMCKHYNISIQLYDFRLKKGWTQEKALTTLAQKIDTATDHLGQEYPSVAAMCKHYGIKTSVYNTRRKFNWSIEDALTKPKQHTPRNAKKYTDHLGQEFPSIAAMCRHWNIRKDTFTRRTDKYNWPLEKALTTPSTETYTDHKGNNFNSLNEMCEYWGITYSTYKNRIENDYSLEEALTPNSICRGKYTDHLGNTFTSLQKMCDHWNIYPRTYQYRISQDWTVEKALTTPITVKSRGKQMPITDYENNTFPTVKAFLKHHNISQYIYDTYKHNPEKLKEKLIEAKHKKPVEMKQVEDYMGNKFDSYKDLCDYHNVKIDTFMTRLNKNWSMYDCIHGRRQPVYDHKNNKFDSITQMCQHWGLNIATYWNRINTGMSVEEALTYNQNRKCIDHLGNEFNTLSDMCKYWNVNPTTYKTRLKSQNYTLEEALCGKPEPHQDHLGNRFPTLEAMCKHWNISVSAYLSRRKKKWTIEEILTTDNILAQTVIDHKGNKFSSIRQMCTYWGIPNHTYDYRRKNGWTLRECLCGKIQIPMNGKGFTIDENFTITDMIEEGYYTVNINEKSIILTTDAIYNYIEKKQLKEQIPA